MPRVRRQFVSLRFSLAAVLGAAVSLIPIAGAHAQETIEVSTTSDGKSAGIVVDGFLSQGAVSSDGRFVAFVTKAATLVPGDHNGSFDVFVKDVQTNVTKRVSVASDGSERIGDSGKRGVDISDDGQIVVFTSVARLTDAPNTCTPAEPSCQQIFAHNLATGETTMVSVSSTGAQANYASDGPSVSGDGRYVSFDSYAWNLSSIGNSSSTNVWVHDRLAHTTRRASIPSGGLPPMGGLSFRSRLNGDGSLVAFVSMSNFGQGQEQFPCPNTTCMRAWIHDRATNTTTRVPIEVTPTGHPWAGPGEPALDLAVHSVDIDSSGRFVAMLVKENIWPSGGTAVLIYDRLTGQTRKVAEQFASTVWYPVHISGDGRFVQTAIAGVDPIGGERLRYDRINGFRSQPSHATIALSGTGRYGVEVSSNGGVYRVDFDHDNDGMDDDWERFFWLSGDHNGAEQDADGDGLTNFQEHEAGTHPNGNVKRYLAEGAANGFFTTRIALFNPGHSDATVVLRFQGADGQESSHMEQLDQQTRKTVILTPGMNIPANDFATLVESNQPIVVDRTMTWDASGYGAHAETSLESPATTWYFAEGATHGDFSLFYLLQNPNATDARVTIDYLRRAPQPPIVKTYDVPARSRLTIPVDSEGPELAAEDLAAKIDATVPIVAERAMYASRPGHPVFTAGHGGAGVTSPALKWFLAEGATGSFFDLYVLVANPNASDAQLTVTYLFPSGDPLVKQYTAGANNRLTISVEEEDARLRSTPVSIVVESTNNQPVVVERAMWWPQYPWYEAHLSAGATATGTKWALAEGEVDTAAGTDTYILIANTGPSDGSATIRFIPEPLLNTLSYREPQPFTVTVPLLANSRTNVIAGLEPRLRDLKFSTIIESDGVPIVVERAMYRTTGGLIWSSGTSALATRLQ